MSADYKDKIRKLLALSESPNENEARAALLKARELMAKYKLSESDITPAENLEIKKIITPVTYSKRRDSWANPLSSVIAENYCCKGGSLIYKGKQTRQVEFVGFEDDVELCAKIFEYAIDCIHAGIKELRQNFAPYFSAQKLNQMCVSYGYGYVNGIDQAFKRQQEEMPREWAIVLTTPEQVLNATRQWEYEKYAPAQARDINTTAFYSGISDGEKFDPRHRLHTDENALTSADDAEEYGDEMEM